MTLKKPGLQRVVFKSCTFVNLLTTLTRLLKLQTFLVARRTETLVSDLRSFASFLQNFNSENLNSHTDIFWCPTVKFLEILSFVSCEVSFKLVFETNQNFWRFAKFCLKRAKFCKTSKISRPVLTFLQRSSRTFVQISMQKHYQFLAVCHPATADTPNFLTGSSSSRHAQHRSRHLGKTLHNSKLVVHCKYRLVINPS